MKNKTGEILIYFIRIIMAALCLSVIISTAYLQTKGFQLTVLQTLAGLSSCFYLVVFIIYILPEIQFKYFAYLSQKKKLKKNGLMKITTLCRLNTKDSYEEKRLAKRLHELWRSFVRREYNYTRYCLNKDYSCWSDFIDTYRIKFAKY